MSIPAIFKPLDILILLVVFTIAFLWSNSGNKSQEFPTQLHLVTSTIDDTISLFTDTIIYLDHVTVKISNASAAITQSDCPNGLCVQTGYISTPGQISVCMPNAVWIEILGQETDIVTY